jgi:uncharacterized repeat protein (TIGR01451 family)
MSRCFPGWLQRTLRVAGLPLVVLTVLLVALPSGAGAVSATHSGRPVVGMGSAHWFGPSGHGNFGAVPARPSAAGLSAAAANNLANPSNNEIMPTTNTHLIFWLPAGFHYSGGTTAATDLAYENAITKYFQDIGGSQILNTTTQYCGKNGCPADTSTFKDSIVDTTAYPDTGADSAHAITQTNINTEISAQITNKSWPLGLSDMYFVFLPNNLVDCNDAKTQCNTNKYCAYHTRGWQGSDTPANDFIWADQPDNRSVASVAAGCNDSNVTGNESADTTLSAVEHEQMEAITDPRGNAWQDSTGGVGENGDKCNQLQGVADASSTTTNNFLGAGGVDLFRIQREWSNAAALAATGLGTGCAASYTLTGSRVESPVPSGSDVAKSVTESSIAGNTSDTLHYTLTFKNPSNQDDAYGVSVTDTLPAGVQSGGSSTVSFNLGDLAPHQTATKTFTAQPTGPLLDGTTLTNSATFDFNDSTGAAQPSITRTAATTVVNTPPTIDPLPDPQSVDYHDALSFNVSASDADAGDTLSLSATGLPAGLALVDNGNGTATISGTDTAAPGDYIVTITADDHHQVLPTTATMTIHVLREETSITYNGQTVILVGSSGATLSAQLQEDSSAAPTPLPLASTVTLTLGSQQCPADTISAAGVATCTIPYASLALIGLGPQTAGASFSGDTYYLSSSATAVPVYVFAFPSRGAFVLGDTTAATAGTSAVTWWGDNWYQRNTISGGQAPSSFKGFAANVTTLPTGGTQPTSCSGTFTTAGGNSPPPTSGVPSYMGVLVTSQVKKSGTVIKGNYIHIVVVRVNTGYAPNPMSAGTGTIVATYC